MPQPQLAPAPAPAPPAAAAAEPAAAQRVRRALQARALQMEVMAETSLADVVDGIMVSAAQLAHALTSLCRARCAGAGAGAGGATARRAAILSDVLRALSAEALDPSKSTTLSTELRGH